MRSPAWDPRMAVNRLLDALPHTRLGRFTREVPAFRTCGVVGYYLALITLFAGGLVTGRSLLVLSLLALVCGVSFFAYAYVRRAVTGAEEIVLLEHVWFAQASASLALFGLGEPLAPYLDLLSPALAFFLACGRVGCLLVGCCHGNPSSLGIVYPERHAADGFPRRLVGIRLFPVPMIECAGLVVIGVTGFAALPFAPPGRVFLWLLIGYAVMRFGLEGIRGDHRPHWLRLSQARWMSLVEFAVALWAFERWRGQPLGARELAIGGLLMAVLVGGLGLRHAIDPRRRLLAPEHLRELHALVTAASRGLDGTPQVRQTSRGVTVAVSTALGHGGHVSLSLRDHPCDLTLLCTLGAAAFPTALAESARVSGPGVLHVSLPSLPPAAPPPRESHSTLAAALQASAVRCAQSAEDRPPQASDDDPPATAGAVGLPGPATLQLARRTYFGDASSPSRMRA